MQGEDADVLAVAGAVNKGLQTAPGRFELLEPRVVQDGVQLRREQVVDRGHVAGKQADQLVLVPRRPPRAVLVVPQRRVQRNLGFQHARRPDARGGSGRQSDDVQQRSGWASSLLDEHFDPGAAWFWRESILAPRDPRNGDCPDFRVNESGTVPFDASDYFPVGIFATVRSDAVSFSSCSQGRR